MSDSEELFTRSEVLQLLGRWGLPPWTDHDGTQLGGKVDCAALAEDIAASVDAVHEGKDPHSKISIKTAQAVLRKHGYESRKYEGYGTPGGRDPMG